MHFSKYEVCLESIQPLWTSWELVWQIWCNLAGTERGMYCTWMISPTHLELFAWQALREECTAHGWSALLTWNYSLGRHWERNVLHMDDQPYSLGTIRLAGTERGMYCTWMISPTHLELFAWQALREECTAHGWSALLTWNYSLGRHWERNVLHMDDQPYSLGTIHIAGRLRSVSVSAMWLSHSQWLNE